MTTHNKLTILAESAKYDAACTSSGVTRKASTHPKAIGNASPIGCCHSFSADGRCITLLKVLLSNDCVFDCKYCINRRSHDVPRATFTPEELADLTIQFYRRNYIEGLFLSSGVIKSPDYTTEQMIRVLELLRHTHHFGGYIHAKIIPGTAAELINQLGMLADRVSVNIEFPSEASLNDLAPQKKKKDILKPMAQISRGITTSKAEVVQFKHAPVFAGGGQATQMIIGASPETDYHIIRLASGMYDKYRLKRVFYSAYVPTVADKLLPALDTKPPLLREHRLYQADWLMRKYHFHVDEILSEANPNFNPYLDPKCNWAVNNFHLFPVNIATADYQTLLRVPGIGPTSALRIIKARRHHKLGMPELKRMGVVLKRAQYFITTADQPTGVKSSRYLTARALMDPHSFSLGVEQLSLFNLPEVTPIQEEATQWLATRL